MPANRKKSNNNILNNLKDHVDSGDVLFVVSGDASNNQHAIDEFNCCKSKCAGRRKLDRNLHSKVVDASQFETLCDQPECTNAIKLEKSSKNTIEQPVENVTEKKPKRLDDRPNRNRNKHRGLPATDNKRRREIILRQMKNHRVSTTSMDDGSRQKLM